jgi:DNA-binding NtrC family response regulator
MCASSESNLGGYLDAERDPIERALQMAEWNKARAARILGISREKLYSRITRYSLAEPDHFRPALPRVGHSY